MKETSALKRLAELSVLLLGLIPSILTLVTLLGLGLHRHAVSWAISLTATILVFGPPLVATAMSRSRRALVCGGLLSCWSIFLFLSLPVYFPGERQQAFVSGLSLLGLGSRWENTAQFLGEALPEEPQVAEPELLEAPRLTQAFVKPSPALAAHEISIPYEGEGRRMSVELAVQQGEQILELEMMLDTGATYTTLPRSVLNSLGIELTDDDPVIRLQTANGERDAQIVLIDRLWLGDLALEGVAIATCDACASEDSAGLLGLNVTGGYNLHIDADRREVIFSTRTTFNRHLDFKPFSDIKATVSRFPGGRVEVTATLQNNAKRALESATVSIHCDKEEWLVHFGPLAIDEEREVRRRLPPHSLCQSYQVGLYEASW